MRRWLTLLAVCTALAVLHTWPLAANLGTLSRLDNADAALNIWIITWVAHGLTTQPLSLFEAPIFYPEAHTLAYSEHMLVPSLLGAPLIWAGVSPILTYNLLVIVGLALSAWTMTLVMARWTGSTAGGLVAGLLYAFNAHLLTRFVHLQALHIEFLPIALYAFDRVLRGGSGRDVALLAAAFVLQSLCSNYTMVFLAAALLVAAVVRWHEWLYGDTRQVKSRLALAAATSVVALLPFLWPYYLVARDQGLTRSLDEVALYSAGWLDYLATGGRLHYAWWSHRIFDGRTALFPGVVAVVLAVVALARGPSRRDPRVQMAVAFGLMGFALSFGPALPGYSLLHTVLPPLQGLRGAARWGFLLLIATAILAGYGVAALDERLRASRYRVAALVAVAGLVTIEALRAPMGFVPVRRIPALYARLAAEPDPIVVELPIYSGDRLARNSPAMIGNALYLRPMLNGYSGFQPASYVRRAERLRAFPAPDALAELRQLRVSHIVVRVKEFVDTEGPKRLAEVEALPDVTLVAEADGVRLYRLR